MRQDFIVEFDYFETRNFIFYLLNKIATEQSSDKLTGYSVFINNIPTSLEFYAFLSYEKSAENEIEQMKELLFPIGIYRPDISLKELLNRISERGFNSHSVDPLSIPFIRESFWFKERSQLPSKHLFSAKNVQGLKDKGYNALEKLPRGTSLFLSHSSKQKQEVEIIMPYLNSRNELIWLDKYRLEQTGDFNIVKKEIAKGLNEANKVLFYITIDFLKSDWCIYELELSSEIYHASPNYILLFIVKFDVKDQFMERYSQLLQDISKKHIIILETNEKLESVIEKLPRGQSGWV